MEKPRPSSSALKCSENSVKRAKRSQSFVFHFPKGRARIRIPGICLWEIVGKSGSGVGACVSVEKGGKFGGKLSRRESTQRRLPAWINPRRPFHYYFVFVAQYGATAAPP